MSNVKILKSSLSSIEGLAIKKGKGDMPLLEIKNKYAEAVISIYGAQVLSYKKTAKSMEEENDLFFVSQLAYYESGKAIKGGVPICWPWFGKNEENPDLQTHGFARNMLWDIDNAFLDESGETTVVFSLTQNEYTHQFWPYDFELTLTLKVGKTLKLSLETKNTGEEAFSITQAFHPYFSISEISQVKVNGLGEVDYLDKVTGASEMMTQVGDIIIDQEVDRIYIDAPSETLIHDTKSDRNITIQSKGSATTVVWNPWAEISQKSGDLEDDDYLKFICVEAANAAEDIVTILPNKSYTLEAEYSVS